MTTAVICTALLGLLVFGLGLAVSLTRGQTGTIIGANPDPTDRLYKMVRAHANATEYAPMLAVLMLFIGTHNPVAWIVWVMWIATVSRYLHAAGMIFCPTLAQPHPLRFIGALGTYLCGLILSVVAFFAL
jgi:uncharacterized membrane protein YecN with MAPEG domain